MKNKNARATLNNFEIQNLKERNGVLNSKDHPVFDNGNYSSIEIILSFNFLSKFICVLVLQNGSMYPADHDLSLQMEGLDKPRRKRGRPPKNIEEEIKVKYL